MMEQDRIIGPGQGAKPREILVGPEYLERRRQVTRRVRRSLLLLLAAVLLARRRARAQELDQVVAGVEATYGKITRPAGGVHPGREQQEPRAGHQGRGNGLSQEGRQDALGLQEPIAAADRLRRDVALGVHARAEPGEQGERAEGAGRPGGQLSRRPRARARGVHRALPEPRAEGGRVPAGTCWTSSRRRPRRSSRASSCRSTRRTTSSGRPCSTISSRTP